MSTARRALAFAFLYVIVPAVFYGFVAALFLAMTR